MPARVGADDRTARPRRRRCGRWPATSCARAGARRDAARAAARCCRRPSGRAGSERGPRIVAVCSLPTPAEHVVRPAGVAPRFTKFARRPSAFQSTMQTSCPPRRVRDGVPNARIARVSVGEPLVFMAPMLVSLPLAQRIVSGAAAAATAVVTNSDTAVAMRSEAPHGATLPAARRRSRRRAARSSPCASGSCGSLAAGR